MPKDKRRVNRVSELLKQGIYEILREDSNDPRIGMLSITKVTVSKDLRYVKVYISCIKEEETEETLIGLSSARGFIQRKLGQKIRLRNIPHIEFIEDASIKNSLHIMEVLEELKK